MRTSAKATEKTQSSNFPDAAGRNSLLSWACVVVNLALSLGYLFFAQYVVRLDVEQFGRLGLPVQYFIGLILVLAAGVAALASFNLVRGRGSGRYLTIAIQYGAMVLTVAFLFHLWGVYFSFEAIVDGVIQNTQLTLGFAVAYALYWLAGRLAEDNRLRSMLEMIAVGLAMLTLIALLALSGILEAANHVLSTYSNPITWITTVAAIVFGFLAWRILYMGERFGETPQQRTAWQGWLMLSPNIIGFLLFFAGPLLLSFYLSFTDSSVGQVPNIIGLENYANILALEIKTLEDPSMSTQSVMSFGFSPLGTFDIAGTRLVLGAKDTLFWLSLRNTLLFCLLLIPLAVIPALGMSLILNSKLPGVKFFRAIYFLPSVAAVVGTALIWRWLYDPTIGYYNYTISQIVGWLNQTFGFGLADPNIQWLTDPAVVLISMVLLSAWGVVGYNTVLFLAGLQGIPHTLYEAAMIDGANRWQQFRNVTLPMLAPTTFFVMITTIVTGLQVFNEPYTLFPAQPIPVNATTSVYYLYRRGFFFFEFGYASAIAWLLFAIIFGITLIQFRVQRSGAYED